MAHYAFLDENNIVTEVIVGKDENELIEDLLPEVWYAQYRNQVCKRTSYNGKIRKHFAGVGFSYSEALDSFIPPKPFDSWILNEDSCLWEAPVAYPLDGKVYDWDESLQDWVRADA